MKKSSKLFFSFSLSLSLPPTQYRYKLTLLLFHVFLRNEKIKKFFLKLNFCLFFKMTPQKCLFSCKFALQTYLITKREKTQIKTRMYGHS